MSQWSTNWKGLRERNNTRKTNPVPPQVQISQCRGDKKKGREPNQGHDLWYQPSTENSIDKTYKIIFVPCLASDNKITKQIGATPYQFILIHSFLLQNVKKAWISIIIPHKHLFCFILKFWFYFSFSHFFLFPISPFRKILASLTEVKLLKGNHLW